MNTQETKYFHEFQTILEDTQRSGSTAESSRTPDINVTKIFDENEDYFNEDVDCFDSNNVAIELTSSRYFVGYIAQRITCAKCRVDIIKPAKVLTYPSEMFVHAKNYDTETDFGSLCAPSDLFFAHKSFRKSFF